MNNILLTGGTGNLGSNVAALLAKKNFQLSLLSTRNNTPQPNNVKVYLGDLATGSGLKEATKHADIILHLASNSTDFENVDITGTHNLLKAINKSRTRHFIYVSIVGIDKSDFPYYRAKLAAEKLIEESGIPYTILRATQFHEFIFDILQAFASKKKNDTILIPGGMKFQSVSIHEVAHKLTELCNTEPSKLLPDFAGPEILTFEEMADIYAAIFKLTGKIKTSDIKGKLYDVFRSGINLSPDDRYGKITWKSFLGEKLNSSGINLKQKTPKPKK